MTKKERENLLINAWRLAGHIERSSNKNTDDSYLSGLFHAQVTLLRGFDIDFTKIQVARIKGLTYEEMLETLKEK